MARGTLPAIDHGMRGAMTMTLFSSEMAIFSLSGTRSEQSWCVSIVASVWLQEIIDVAVDTAVMIRALGTRFPAFAI